MRRFVNGLGCWNRLDLVPICPTLAALGFALVVSSGCYDTRSASARSLPTAQSVTIPKRSREASSLKDSPEYQAAVKAFTKGDKQEALKALESLRHSPNLSAHDQAFLDRQIAICKGEKPKPTTNTPSAIRAGKPVSGAGDCGPRALALAAKELGIKTELPTLTKACGTSADGTSLEGLVKGAKTLGLKAEGVQVDKSALAQLQTPLLAWWEGNHYVAVLKVSENFFNGEQSATIHDPNDSQPKDIRLADLLAKSGGIFLTLKK